MTTDHELEWCDQELEAFIAEDDGDDRSRVPPFRTKAGDGVPVSRILDVERFIEDDQLLFSGAHDPRLRSFDWIYIRALNAWAPADPSNPWPSDWCPLFVPDDIDADEFDRRYNVREERQ